MSDVHLCCKLRAEMVLWFCVHFVRCVISIWKKTPGEQWYCRVCQQTISVLKSQNHGVVGRDLKDLVPASLLWGGTLCSSPGCSGSWILHLWLKPCLPFLLLSRTFLFSLAPVPMSFCFGLLGVGSAGSGMQVSSATLSARQASAASCLSPCNFGGALAAR